MTRPMAPERFRLLADAYGGVVSRWPEHERAAAAELSARPEGIAALRAASALDVTLDGWRVPPPGAALRERIVAGAPASVASFPARARLWWSGIGIAAALAGAVAGVAAVAIAAPADMMSEAGTAFGDIASQGS